MKFVQFFKKLHFSVLAFSVRSNFLYIKVSLFDILWLILFIQIFIPTSYKPFGDSLISSVTTVEISRDRIIMEEFVYQKLLILYQICWRYFKTL